MTDHDVHATRRRIAAAARRAHELGWMPATAGNVSERVADEVIVISASGVGKGRMTEDLTVVVDIGGGRVVARPGEPKPSAETAIHAAIYRTTGCDAVLHVHSPHATAASVRFGTRTTLSLESFELAKGVTSNHEDRCDIPLFGNHRDVGRIADEVDDHLARHGSAVPAVLIAGHGLTTWASTLDAALDIAEGVESLCQVALLADSTTGCATTPVAPVELAVEKTERTPS